MVYLIVYNVLIFTPPLRQDVVGGSPYFYIETPVV